MPIAARAGAERWNEWLFAGYRVLWWTGLALILVVNFYVSPRDEWSDRDNAIAAVRLALRTSAHPSPSSDGESVGPFGTAGEKIGVGGGDHLLAVNGRALPADTAGRTAAMSGPRALAIVRARETQEAERVESMSLLRSVITSMQARLDTLEARFNRSGNNSAEPAAKMS